MSQIFVEELDGHQTPIEVDAHESIHNLKQKIASTIGMPVQQQKLIYDGQEVDSGTLADCSIRRDSVIRAVLRLRGGGCSARPTESAGFWFQDHEGKSTPLPAISLTSHYFNRNTNITRYHDQSANYPGRKNGSCYAHAACYAYLNTVTRIYGARPPPSFAECFQVADYNEGSGGKIPECLQRLEDAFGFGVCWEILDSREAPTIREIMMESCVVSFTTSQEGYRSIQCGELLKRPAGPSNGRWHATLMEGYDLDFGCTMAKNSWGDNGVTEPRFALNLDALHDWYVTRVFFTVDSIRGKTTKKLPPPRMERFVARLEGRPIHCAWMDELTATYTSDYVCQPHCSRSGEIRFLGYEVDEWINAIID